MANRLASQSSPYLREHAENPVDWYPWGPEALQRARAEGKPILLSIGYSACHWCHVMARESFEDPEVAALMNRSFVSIKVDREERPDLDQIYMKAVQGLTGSGGWPMTVFLLPDGTPFFGGTYFPPADRYGMPSFRRVLLSVAEAFATRRAEVEQTAGQVKNFLRRSTPRVADELLSPAMLDEAYQRLAHDFDPVHGGFGGAPKFPQPMVIDFLLRTNARTGDQEALRMATHSLRSMAAGGMYDQLGGGFHRYAVDGEWLVPHFEKMLYDNALLARAYLDGWQVTGEQSFRRTVEETLAFVRREMTSPEGGFFSSLDADSEGEEGRFYLWTPAELEATLGVEEARQVAAALDVTEQGNFEGRNILHPLTPEAEQIMRRVRGRMMAARDRRVRPHRDEKVLAGWNGLMLRAFAEAGRVLARTDFVEVATTNARFILDQMRDGERIRRSYQHGSAILPGYLEDQAAVADGLLSLYEATFDPSWLTALRGIVNEMLGAFWDAGSGAFFDTAADHEELVVRPQDATDNAVPSGTSMAADLLLRAGALLGEERWTAIGRQVLQSTGPTAAKVPLAFGRLLAALDFELGRPVEVAIIGRLDAAETAVLRATIAARYLPNHILAAAPPGGSVASIPLLQGRPAVGGRATAYVCEGFVCRAPATTAEALREELDRVSRRPVAP